MLGKFVHIENLGLLHNSGCSPQFAPTTLLYADNGRGKSTLCSLLRSLQTGESAHLLRRQTVDQSGDIGAKIVFRSGPSTSELVAEGWDHPRPNIRVFDADFVRNNVHSGPEVQASHRRNLLQFALGDEAVAEAAREAAATQEARGLREQIRLLEEALSHKHVGMSLADFIALPELEDLPTLLVQLETELRSVSSSTAILARPRPAELPRPTWAPAALFAILETDLQDLGDEAEALVQAHVVRIHEDGLEAWIRSGTTYQSDDRCPYCDQSLDKSHLVRAYRTYFDARYQALHDDLDAAEAHVTALMDRSYVEKIAGLLDVQNSRVAAWSDVVEVSPVGFDIDHLRVGLETIRAEVAPLIQAKRTSLLASVDAELLESSLTSVALLWDEVCEQFTSMNDELKATAEAIEAYSVTLQLADASAIEEQRARVVATGERHHADTKAAISTLEGAKARLSAAETEAEAARRAVRSVMDATLNTYQSDINDLLARFGAAFSIEQMKANFMGAPQSEYVISLRGTHVQLKNDSGPNFDSALSEGDKRTLAFAFFTASVLRDREIHERIVVVDDPMSSLDASRRQHTAEVLCQMNDSALQLIVCGHDPVFLRHFRGMVERRDRGRSIAELELTRGAGGYSCWSVTSLDELCETEWVRKYREVVQFVQDGTGDVRRIATHLRPLLEGHLHRRFPSDIPEGTLLGNAILRIQDAEVGSPLQCAVNSTDEIERINTYAGQFHHEATLGFSEPIVTDSEVMTYAKATLDVVHGKTLP